MALLWRLLLAPPPPKRIALVVGNSAYQDVSRLDNPRNDAALMADTLASLGFALIGGRAQLDLDKPGAGHRGAELRTANPGRRHRPVLYAGHGVQVSGSNYLVPVGANPTREADVDFQMVDINLVLRQMQGSGTRLNIVILDACRNNPFGARGLRASDGGLAQMRAPEGTLISYATQPGSVAQDGSGGHSPYTRALAATIRRAGLDIFQTFNQVGLAVKRGDRRFATALGVVVANRRHFLFRGAGPSGLAAGGGGAASSCPIRCGQIQTGSRSRMPCCCGN